MEQMQKALYNSLRMNFHEMETLDISSWKIEDLRPLASDELFRRLHTLHHIDFDKVSFCAYAEQAESPEELTVWVVDDSPISPEEQDQIYLLIFELWRRFASEKKTLSIICDELDYQFFAYDSGRLSSLEPLEDALSDIKRLLQDYEDEGFDPIELFHKIQEHTAHDIALFIYDYISDELDLEHYDFAEELFDQFYPYLHSEYRFQFLKARIHARDSLHEVNMIIRSIFRSSDAQHDLDFLFDVLAFMIQVGDKELFQQLALLALNFIENEMDFRDLLSICSDFFCCLDYEAQEKALNLILAEREKKSHTDTLTQTDPDKEALKKILLTIQ